MKGMHSFCGLQDAFTGAPERDVEEGGGRLPEMDCFIIAASRHVHERREVIDLQKRLGKSSGYNFTVH